MAADVVPELLEPIERGFNRRYKNNQTIGKLVSKMGAKRAKQADIHRYALETGKCLRDINKRSRAVSVARRHTVL